VFTISFDDSLNKFMVMVNNQNIIEQLKLKKSFELLKDTGGYITGLIDYNDLVFNI